MRPTLFGTLGAASWTPAKITSIAHWYKASHITGLNDGDPVSTWSDLVGSSHATGVTTTRPLYKTGSGSPYLQFDGSDDELTATVAAMTNCTFLVIARWNALVSFHRLFDDGVMAMYSHASGSPGSIYLQGGGSTITDPTLATGAFACFFGKRSGTSGTLRYNGNQTTGALASTSSGTTLHIGAYTSAGFNGQVDIKEMIIVNAAISAGDQTALATYISTQYGLTL